MSPDEFRTKAESLGVGLPEDIKIRIRPETFKTFKVSAITSFSDLYSSKAGEIEGVPVEMRDKDIRSIAAKMRQWDRTWKEVASLDELLGITSKGIAAVNIELDVPFVKMLSRFDVSLESMLQEVRRHALRNQWLGDILSNLRCGFTNREREHLIAEGFKPYPNMHESYNFRVPGLPLFQGSCLGKKPMAFDFMIGRGRYVSSRQPTFSFRTKMPDATLNSLKGKRINDIIDEELFGSSQTILRAWREENVIHFSLTPETVPVLASQLALAA